MCLLKRVFSVSLALFSLLAVQANIENADYSDNDLMAEESSHAAAYAWPQPPQYHRQQSHPLIYQSVGPFAHFGSLPKQQFGGMNCGFFPPHPHPHAPFGRHHPPPSWHQQGGHFDYSDYEDSSEERTPPPPSPTPAPTTTRHGGKRPAVPTPTPRRPISTISGNRQPPPTARPTSVRKPPAPSPLPSPAPSPSPASTPPALSTPIISSGSSTQPAVTPTLGVPAEVPITSAIGTSTTTEEPFLEIDLRFGSGNAVQRPTPAPTT